MFKKKRGINLSYNKQGLIYFICMNVKEQPQEIQDKIINLCLEIADKDYKALYTILTNDNKSIRAVAMEYFISETKLYELRKEFYEKW